MPDGVSSPAKVLLPAAQLYDPWKDKGGGNRSFDNEMWAVRNKPPPASEGSAEKDDTSRAA